MSRYKKFIYIIYEAAFLLDRLIDQILQKEMSLSFAEYRVLMALDNHQDVPQRYIALYWNITEAAISRHVEGLVKMGYISRLIDETNRRQNLLSLTPFGKKQLEKADRYVDEVFENVLEKRHKDKKEEVIKALNTFAEIIHPLTSVVDQKSKTKS